MQQEAFWRRDKGGAGRWSADSGLSMDDEEAQLGSKRSA